MRTITSRTTFWGPVCMLAMGTFLIPVAHAETTKTFLPTDDVTLKQRKPDANYDGRRLEVDASSRKDILLKFAVSGLAGYRVLRATFEMHTLDSSNNGGHLFRAAHQAWSEQTATWNASPPKTGNLIDAVGRVNKGRSYRWDVTSLVTQDGVFSFRMESPSANGADYASKESATPPRLVVVVTDAAPPNTAPSVNAGSDQIITLPDQAFFTGMVSDDGLPNPPGTTSIHWMQVSGPAAATIQQPAQAATSVTFAQAGTYVFQLSATDGLLTTVDPVTVHVNPPTVNQVPSVGAGPDHATPLGHTFTLHGTATDDGLPHGTLTHHWSRVSGPGTVTFSDPTSLISTVDFSVAGTYTVRLTASDGELTATDDVIVTVTPVLSDNLTFPVRATFYYPWFPETWTVNGQHVFYQPLLGYYDSDSSAVVDAHIHAMDDADIDVGIASWWGPDTHQESDRIPLLLNRTLELGSNLKWAMYYEKEGTADPSMTELETDLAYLNAHYTSSPAYARVDGKPVLFVYNADDFTCEIVDKWHQAAQGNWYLVMKVFSNYRSCATQPDSWHQYAPAVAIDHQAGYSTSISPGFWRADESTPRLARDATRWSQNIQDMIATEEPWQLITTFNEWGEGTAIEAAEEWGAAYLDALKHNGHGGPTDPTVTISPLTAQLTVNKNQTFTATVTGTENTDVTWAASNGTVLGSGSTITYTPPNQTGTFTLTAQSVEDPTVSATATIQVSQNHGGEVVTFATAGDFGGRDDRAGVIMNDMKHRGIDAFLLLGDVSYDEITPESAWCDWVHSYLEPQYPFQLIAGNHEEDSRVDGHILAFAACMPDRMNSDLGPGGYAVNYAFDLGPLTVVAISPNLEIDAVDYRYRDGSAERDWLVNTIREAKAETDWVVVGMHKNCITIGNKSCEIGQDLAQLLIHENVDLVVQGHDHDYQRSHALNTVQSNTFSPSFVADDGRDGRYVKGAGTVFVIVGTVGRSLTTCSHTDSEFPYFAHHYCAEEGNDKGYLLMHVNQDRMDIETISTGTLQDQFSIE